MNLLKLPELKKPFICVDIGSNWCVGNTEADRLILAKRHIYDAAICGVDAVKFQLFTDRELYGFEGPNKYALPRNWIPELAAYAATQGVEFMCSAFSVEGIHYVDNFVNIHKLASAEMKHPLMLQALGKTKKPTIISTGGAHFLEKQWALKFWESNGFDPDQMAFLECVALYPASASDYNLKTIQRDRTIGLSDHCTDAFVAGIAVGCGAWFFEKHFNALADCRDQTILPDYSVSIGVKDLNSYVMQIHSAYSALGDGEKRTRGSEKEMTMKWRRRLKIIKRVARGDMLVYGENFGIFRSMNSDPDGDAPEKWEYYNGAIASCSFKIGDGLFASDITRKEVAQ